jgi:hypothetical protein
MHCDSEELCYYFISVFRPTTEDTPIPAISTLTGETYQDNISIYTSGIDEKFDLKEKQNLEDL